MSDKPAVKHGLYDPEGYRGSFSFVDHRSSTSVSIQNLSFDPLGRVHKLVPGRARRWWRAKRGWTHYVG